MNDQATLTHYGRSALAGFSAVMIAAIIGICSSATAQAYPIRYCGPGYTVRGPLGTGLSDFYTRGAGCHGARSLMRRWIAAGYPSRMEGWKFSKGYTVRAKKGRRGVRCSAFGSD